MNPAKNLLVVLLVCIMVVGSLPAGLIGWVVARRYESDTKLREGRLGSLVFWFMVLICPLLFTGFAWYFYAVVLGVHWVLQVLFAAIYLTSTWALTVSGANAAWERFKDKLSGNPYPGLELL
jgi:dolichol kinase